jgi:hypothetical protein
MSLAWKMMESPVGKLKLIASDKGLAAILWKDDRPSRVRLSDLVENNQHLVLVENRAAAAGILRRGTQGVFYRSRYARHSVSERCMGGIARHTLR